MTEEEIMAITKQINLHSPKELSNHNTKSGLMRPRM